MKLCEKIDQEEGVPLVTIVKEDTEMSPLKFVYADVFVYVCSCKRKTCLPSYSLYTGYVMSSNI